MIPRIQNSAAPAVSQPDIESFDASKNEVSIETLEFTDTGKPGALIKERKLQANLQAAELHKQLDQLYSTSSVTNITTNNKDPEG
jgi:hypothetical protein